MNITTTVTLDKEYLSECYDQLLRYGSRWRVIELGVGIIFLLGGVALFVYTNWATPLPLVFIGIGLFEIFSNRIKTFFWLRRHARSKSANAQVEMLFDDEGFESRTRFASGRVAWDAMEKCVRTPKGILLWPYSASYYYIPELLVGSEALDFIESTVS